MNMYSSTAECLKDRILSLIPDNPDILKIDSAWDLFKINDFNCDDLQPSAFQAQWALTKAKQEYLEQERLEVKEDD
jgi:hypothetical protein